MRKLFILCAFLLQYLLLPAYPQQATTATIEPNLKYGKPSKEELSLTSYPVADKLPGVFVTGIPENGVAVFVGEITRGGTPRPVHVKLRTLRGGARRQRKAD